MDKLLTSYIRVYKGCLSKKVCNTTIQDFSNIQWHKADWGSGYQEEKIHQPGEHNRFESYDSTSTIDNIMNTCRNFLIKKNISTIKNFI